MHRLNEFAPALGGVALLAYAWWVLFRIKREQAMSRAKGEAAE